MGLLPFQLVEFEYEEWYEVDGQVHRQGLFEGSGDLEEQISLARPWMDVFTWDDLAFLIK